MTLREKQHHLAHVTDRVKTANSFTDCSCICNFSCRKKKIKGLIQHILFCGFLNLQLSFYLNIFKQKFFQWSSPNSVHLRVLPSLELILKLRCTEFFPVLPQRGLSWWMAGILCQTALSDEAVLCPIGFQQHPGLFSRDKCH
jgi:hypothetical protein